MRPSLNRTPTVLPMVYNTPHRGRHNGSQISKNELTLPSLSKDSFSSISKRLQARSKESMMDYTNSISQFKILDTEHDITYNESPSRDLTKLGGDSPSRLRRTEIDSWKKFGVGAGEDITRKKLRPIRNPNIDSYLDYLGSTFNGRLSNFASKMREKSNNPGDGDTILKQEEGSDDEKPVYGDVIPLSLKSPGPGEPIRLTLKDPTPFLDLTPIPYMVQQATPLKRIPLEIIDSPKSPSNNNNSSDANRGKKSGTFVEKKNDEKIAQELAEEVTSNYRHYMANAAKDKDLHTKMIDLLTGEGVLPVFYGKVYKQFPLSLRIFKDMTECVEVEAASPKRGKPQGSPVAAISRRKVPVKKIAKMIKLIPNKYEAYKSVNKELIEVNAKYKVQGLQALEGKLLQAHDDFIRTKKQVLKSFSKSNAQKYIDLKAQCEGVENILWYKEYMHDEPKDKDHEETETMMINKGLESVMKTWNRNLIEKK